MNFVDCGAYRCEFWVAGELQTLSEPWCKSPVDPQDRCVGS